MSKTCLKPLDLPLEKTFQKKFLEHVRALQPSWWAKLNDRTTIGLPDVTGVGGGVSFFIELKTKTALSPIQAHTLRKIERAGAVAICCSPSNFVAVVVYIRQCISAKKRLPITPEIRGF